MKLREEYIYDNDNFYIFSCHNMFGLYIPPKYGLMVRNTNVTLDLGRILYSDYNRYTNFI